MSRPDTRVQTFGGTLKVQQGRLLLKIRVLVPALFSNL